jgi:hypothetical protein
MDPMTTTMLDRVVSWNLDLDGDLYGDERERLRWYEGMATAASLQWILVPWVAAILVWILGRGSVLPLGVILAVMYLPMVLSLNYVRGRRVNTTVRSWSPKRILLAVLGVPPYPLFILGACRAYEAFNESLLRGIAVGAVIGGAGGAAFAVIRSRQLRRAEARALAAGAIEDED